MLRYDPTKQDHSKYLAPAKRKPDPANNADDKSKRSKNDEDYEEPAAPMEVSKEQFYKVNKDLSSSLWQGGAQSGGSFSLLSMFGTATETPQSCKPAYRETLIGSTGTQRAIEDMTNPFKYDSSDDDQEVPAKSTKKTGAKPSEPLANGKVIPKSGTKVWHETFFILGRDDERLKGKYISI